MASQEQIAYWATLEADPGMRVNYTMQARARLWQAYEQDGKVYPTSELIRENAMTQAYEDKDRWADS